MSQHTPGPWEVQKTSHLEIYITQPHNLPNRKPGFYAEVRRFTPNSAEVEANARLIAAAPEMLKALEMLVEKIKNDEWFEDWSKIATSVIAKAKGKTK